MLVNGRCSFCFGPEVEGEVIGEGEYEAIHRAGRGGEGYYYYQSSDPNPGLSGVFWLKK